VSKRFIAVACVVGAVAISACGSSSSSNHTTTSSVDQTAQFKTGYAAATNSLKNTSAAIGSELNKAASQTDAQFGTAIRQLASRWQTESSQLDTLKPPASVSAEFNSVTSAVSRVEADLTQLGTAADTHSKSAAVQAVRTLASDVQSAKSASRTIDTKLGIKR
jgi:hypothetical protein